MLISVILVNNYISFEIHLDRWAGYILIERNQPIVSRTHVLKKYKNYFLTWLYNERFETQDIEQTSKIGDL